MKRIRGMGIAAGLVAALLFVAAPALAQFWLRKDYGRWTQQECRQMLRRSPWADTYSLKAVLFQPVQQESVVEGRELEPEITYTAQLLSARPVRMAVARLQQLDPRYKQLSGEQRTELDRQLREYVAAEYPDTIVVQLVYGSTARSYDLQLARYWQSQAPEGLKNEIYLIGAPGRIAPRAVQIGTGASREIQLIFPRVVDGRPVLAAGQRDFGIELQHPAIGVFSAERVFIRFDVRKMTTEDGQIIY